MTPESYRGDRHRVKAPATGIDVDRLEKAMSVSLDIYGWDLDVMAREIAAEYDRLTAEDPATLTKSAIVRTPQTDTDDAA